MKLPAPPKNNGLNIQKIDQPGQPIPSVAIHIETIYLLCIAIHICCMKVKS